MIHDTTISQLLSCDFAGNRALKKLLKDWAADHIGRETTNPHEINYAWERCGFIPLVPLRRKEHKFMVIMDTLTDTASLVLDTGSNESSILDAVIVRSTTDKQYLNQTLLVIVKSILRMALVHKNLDVNKDFYPQTVFPHMVDEGIKQYEPDHLALLLYSIITPYTSWQSLQDKRSISRDEKVEVINNINFIRNLQDKGEYFDLSDITTRSDRLEEYIRELAQFAFEGEIED